MKLLAIDTSMQACSAAVFDAGQARILTGRHVLMERGHAEAIAPMVKEVLSEAGIRPAGLDRIAVTVGPGTFTGVRIGLAMAKGMGLALGVPVVGIDTLTAIAQNEKDRGRMILVASDARLEEVYAALFDAHGNPIHAPMIIGLHRIAGLLPDGRVTVMGTAADGVMACNGANMVRSRAGDLPAAAAFAPLAATLPPPASMPRPLYLRSPGAKPQAHTPTLNPVHIRNATALEAKLLAALHGQCFDTTWPPEDFARLMAMPGAISVIAAVQDEPAGFALFRKAADEAEIITIATLPKARRRGVAKSLIDHHSRSLAAEGIASIFIEVAQSNEAAQALYRSCGFKIAGRRKAYYECPGGGREDAIIMRKFLAP
jgi:tRNA threonylcarbamoyladenosine biosynthesis protein TsaB